jgi:F420H(2)-dependent quinone reductase
MTSNTASDTESSLDGEYVPGPLERIRKQVADYEASAGTRGGTVEWAPVVILTSVGAKSGKVRKNPVVRIVDGRPTATGRSVIFSYRDRACSS